jgi:hypothetical protein
MGRDIGQNPFVSIDIAYNILGCDKVEKFCGCFINNLFGLSKA